MRWRDIGAGLDALRVVGVRSAFWFAVYRADCASGLARRRTPLRQWSDLEAAFSKQALAPSAVLHPPFFFENINMRMGGGIPENPDEQKALLAELADVERGIYPFWGGLRDKLGFPPAWNSNPLTGISQPADQHWTRIAEDATGDVKGLWELSRFAVVFRLARIYAGCGEERAADIFWQLIESWMDSNPPNAGAHWISAQEVALRLMAWEFGCNVFACSSSSTESRARRLAVAMGEHARRIEATIAYARAQNNNHLIAEAAGLLTAGWMHPQLPGAARWVRLGRALLEESAGQFFPDGGYIQHSHVYHRFALQLCAWSMRLAEIHGQPFSERLYGRMRASLSLLRALVAPSSGRLSNFGHNDGTLFLPLSACVYDDYRPLVQMLSRWLEKKPSYPPGPWDEETHWLLGNSTRDETISQTIPGNNQFPQAGLYQQQGNESHVVVRAARFHSRPAHSDQLHVDIWWRGVNIAMDPGSYLYGGDPPWRNPFSGAAAHNTITIDGQDPMRRAGRFLWTRLAQASAVRHSENNWEFSHDGYRRQGLIHRRCIARIGPDIWRIMDSLEGDGVHTTRLHWLLPDVAWEWAKTTQEPMPDSMDNQDMLMDLRCLSFSFPAGKLKLWLSASAALRWNIVRAGKTVFGEARSAEDGLAATFGWHSAQYGAKQPALSIIGVLQGQYPVKINSIWSM
jgi:hypothetical protein